jgi:hypothetical protein
VTITDMRNDGMGTVTMADNVDGAICFLCDTDIHNGDRIYIDLDNDQTMHYSHVGKRVNYGVWLGTGIDYDITLTFLEGALIVDTGNYFGYLHPKMEADGFGLAYPGQVHYEYLEKSKNGKSKEDIYG